MSVKYTSLYILRVEGKEHISLHIILGVSCHYNIAKLRSNILIKSIYAYLCIYLSIFDGSQKLLLEFMPDGKLESLYTEAAALRQIVGEAL